MSDERIDIVIQDKVSSSIAAKIQSIAGASRIAGTAVEKLKQQLATLNGSALQNLQLQLNGNTNALSQNALANQRLATEQARTAAATAKAALAQLQLTQAQAGGTQAGLRLAQTQAAQAAAAQRAAQAAQRLATEQQRTAAATQAAEAAAARAALAQLRLQQAQDRANESSKKAAGGMREFVQSVAQILALAASVAVVLHLAEAYTLLQNKLQVVTDTAQQLNTVTQKVFDIANETRTPVEAVAQSFARFDSALINLGKSQDDTARMMRTVNKLFVVGGTTATEQASALLQLSQAFNANVLQADEFRSLSENMPKAVRRSISEVLGITEGALKKASSEGKITGEVLFQAFKKLEGFADSKFAKTTMTMGQGFTVLRNNAVQFFGELNKATGLTAGIAKGFEWLGNNIKTVGLALAVASSLLVVAFGPALLAMVGAATTAVWGFTVALASNPLGLLIVGITAAVAAIALFGDQLSIGNDDLVTLKDTALAVWSFIAQGASVAFGVIASVWDETITWLNNATDGWVDRFSKGNNLIVAFLKSSVNFILGYWVGLYGAVTAVWTKLPGAFKDILLEVVNAFVSYQEFMINAALKGVNKLSKLANNASEKLGLGRLLDEDLSVSLDKYKAETTGAAADLGSSIKKSFSEAFATDFVGNAVSAVEKRAKEISQARIVDDVMQSANNGGLRGTGKADPATPNAKALKAAENRASALRKINAELDSELNGLNMLKPARDIQAKMDQIEINLASKKIKLNSSEKDSIRGKIKALEDAKEVQQAFDQIYEAAIGPQREYNATMTAAQKLLDMNAISSDRYQRVITMAGETLKNATDPMYAMNREIKQQSELLALVGPQQEIGQQMQAAQNDLLAKGIVLSQSDVAALKSKYEALQAQKDVNQELNKIYGETQGAQNTLAVQANALNQAFASGILTLDQYSQRLVKLGVDAANLKINLGDASFADMANASLGTLVSQYENVGRSLTDAFGNFFTSFSDGFANSVGKAIVDSDSLGEALHSVAKEAVSGLISALVKLGIQYSVNALLGQTVGATALAAQTTASVAAAAATAAAWAPAATLASLASFGANSVPAMAGIAATSALTEGLALASMAGFQSGGYTGNGGVSDVAGVVHGREFVMNADATARNRGALEAMNRGASAVAMNSGNVGKASKAGGVNVNVQNYGTSKDFEVEQISADEIRIIARDEAKQMVRREAPNAVAASLGNSNSTVSKSLSKNTQTQRRR